MNAMASYCSAMAETFLPQYPELTPAMRSVLERMHRAPYPPTYEMSAREAKESYETGAGVLEVPKAELARVEDFTLAARDGFAIPARLYAPSREPMPVLVYFHGGGFTIGSVASHDTLCRELARLTPCAVISVGYRLAPEYKFPTAFDDAWDALQWVAKGLGSHAGATQRLAVGGDSAGGTLAAYCAIEARDARIPLALQLLFYPGTAPDMSAPSHHRYGEGLVLEQKHIDWFFDKFIPREQRSDWRFAPLNAEDVEG